MKHEADQLRTFGHEAVKIKELIKVDDKLKKKEKRDLIKTKE